MFSIALIVCCLCSMARVAHLGMTADEIVENVISAVSTISKKLQTVSRASKE